MRKAKDYNQQHECEMSEEMFGLIQFQCQLMMLIADAVMEDEEEEEQDSRTFKRLEVRDESRPAPSRERTTTNYKRKCPDCSRKFKGAMGVGVDRAHAHGYVSPHNNGVSADDEGFLCPFCPKKLASERGRKMHVTRMHRS